MSRGSGHEPRRVGDAALRANTSMFTVAQVDDNVVRRALALAWPDFEVAVCAAAAEASACDALVTRDPDGYPNAPFPVIDPAAALSWITEE